MSTEELNIDDHLNSVNSISKQYCRIMRHWDNELSAAKTKITSLEATLKEKMSEHTQQIGHLLDGQSKLIQRIAAIESRNDVATEGNDEQKSSQPPSNTCDSKLNPSVAAFQYHIPSSNNVTEEKQISFPSKTTPYKPHMKRVQLSMECMRLIQVMKRFKKTSRYEDTIDIKQILNDYLHVIDTYKDDHHFEAIARELGVCDASKCKIFDRHYRDRNASDTAGDARSQIMDTIHCYYQHCYDIGNRLSLEEQMLCENSGENIDNEFINHKIQNVRKILQKKRKYPANMRMRYNTTYKYEQLSLFMNQKTIKSAKQCGECWKVKTGRIDKTNGVFYCNSCWNTYGGDQTNDESHENDIDSDTFHFGVKFEYKKEKNGYSHYDKNENVHRICRKYKSLKDEMLNNAVLTLNHNAFKQELSKAQMYFETAYCRQKYKKMSLDQLLSSMIYCNYDTLQCLFSKTYRLSGENATGHGNVSHQHSNFYHFGSNLTTAVHSFGTILNDNDRLYHGISQKMHFSYIVGSAGKGVSIYCPLSTTREMCVAAHFTNNEGLIVEFSSAGFCPKWFSVSWLSNYGNECEHLCIQNQYGLKISNIIDPSGVQHCSVLSCLYVFSQMIADVKHSDTDNIKIQRMYPLLNKFVQHRLSKESSDYPRCESLSGYGEELLDIFCNNIRNLSIQYPDPMYNRPQLQHIYSDSTEAGGQQRRFSVWEMFCQSNGKTLKIDKVCGLFPSLRRLQFTFDGNAEAKSVLFRDVCVYLLHNGEHTRVREIIIHTRGSISNEEMMILNSCKQMLIESQYWEMLRIQKEYDYVANVGHNGGILSSTITFKYKQQVGEVIY
eukprot:387163_1